MATKLRFTRHGTKKKPFYWLVAADARAPRDGKYIEKLGTYNPLLPKDNDQRIIFNKERISYWLSAGAQPTEKAEKLFDIEGIAISFKSKTFRKKFAPNTSTDKKLSKKAMLKAEEEAKNAEAEKKAAAAPQPEQSTAPEATVTEVPVEQVEAITEAAPTEDVAVEEKKAEETPAETEESASNSDSSDQK
jgi:small subunit ribosomal protein S16